MVKHDTYHILVWVHEDVEAILFCFPQHCYGVIYPLLVVLSWTCMLYRLPCENVP